MFLNRLSAPGIDRTIPSVSQQRAVFASNASQGDGPFSSWATEYGPRLLFSSEAGIACVNFRRGLAAHSQEFGSNSTDVAPEQLASPHQLNHSQG